MENQQSAIHNPQSTIVNLKIALFGSMEVQADGKPLPKMRSRKELWLLALLTLQQERPVTRAWLAQTLWPFPDHATDQAAYNLRRCLTNLRKALGKEAPRIQSPTSDTLRFDLQNAAVDVLAFDAALARGDPASLGVAIELYGGPLLLECTETWAMAERARREQQYLHALKTLSGHALTGGDYETAAATLRRAVAVDPLWEPAQRALMEALARSSDVHAALQLYQEFSLRLHRDRNAVPGAETTALYHALRTELRGRQGAGGTPRGAVASAASGSAASAVSSAASVPALPPLRRLPIPLTALIGRETEIREIETRFRTLRLLTLTGAGGVGKTRLVIQLAEELAGEFQDGACFVDMAALTDATQVAQMTAAALEVPEEPDRPLLQTLLTFLQTRQLLLILDNCEHLIEASAHLAETLLQGCRSIRILATSRQSLGVGGEGVWRVTSLSLPDARHLPSDGAILAERLGNYAAIQLFVERAAQAQAGFHLTAQNAHAVAQICQQLDGIPLALELAAARVRALPVEQIAERLVDRFHLLTNGPRTALSRQQTLEAAIKWSFDLLADSDRALLCALSVFVGGWTLEAAEAVGQSTLVSGQWSKEKSREGGRGKKEDNSPGSYPEYLNTEHRTPEHLILDILARLVDRSLVIYEAEEGQARYRLLETVRQYSREKLMDADTQRWASERHLDFYLQLAEEAQSHLQSSEQAGWLNRLEREHDNLRAALEYSATEPEQAAKNLRMTASLWRFWHRRGYLSLGRRYLANALEQAQMLEPTPILAEAYNGAGMLAFFQGDVSAARRYYEASLEVGTALGQETLRANALHSLGQMAWNRHEHARARALFMDALAIQRALANKTHVAVTLNYLGVVASDEGDYEGAQRFCEESLGIGRELGDKSLIANSLHSLAHNAFYQDDYEMARRFYSEELKLARSLQNLGVTATTLHRLGCVEQALQNYAHARGLFEESLGIARNLGHQDLVAAVLYNLGSTHCALGDYPAAHACFAERLAISEERGDNAGIASTLDAFAGLLAAQKQERRAVVLFAATEELRESSAPSVPPINLTEATFLRTARSVLGEADFAQAWETGRALTLEQAIAYARQESHEK